ncbi:MAG: hypothetical protein PHN82_11270 [bacterium]|nr:hypothetical protein [bacterium]
MRTVVLILAAVVLAAASGCGVTRRAEVGGEVIIAYWDIEAEPGGEPRYDTKCVVSVDGAPAGESAAADRYERKEMSLRLPAGERLIVVEGWALRGGRWERRTQANGYPQDHRLEKKVDLGAGDTQRINFVVPGSGGTIRIPF